MIKMYVITEDELRYLVEGFVYQEHETTLKIDNLVRSRPIDNDRLFAALDELYKFVDGLDPDFIIRERIAIMRHFCPSSNPPHSRRQGEEEDNSQQGTTAGGR